MNLSFSITRSKQTPAVTGAALMQSSKIMPEHAKLMRQINGRMMRMYAAALSNNSTADFPISISSANAEIFTSIMPTRSRARTLERDNPYAWAMLESMRVNVGGHEPFRLEMNVGHWEGDKWVKEKEVNRLIESAWKEAGLPENCTTRGDISRLELDLQAITGMVRDGGVLGRHIRDFPHNKFRYAIRPLEIDRLDHYWQGKNPQTGNDIKMSIELDEWDHIVGYWLLTKHPGEIFQIANLKQGYREFVPAKDLITLFDIRTRAEQLTAVSRFASVIQRLHRIDQFDVAHVTAAIWSACKPIWLTKDFPTAMEYLPDGIKNSIQGAMDAYSSGEGEKIQSVEPGSAEELPYGIKPVQMDPKFPIEAATGFKQDNLRAAAAGSGTAYHMIGQDLSSVNFSSGRLGENQFHDTCKILQVHYVDNYRRPHFNAWLANAMLTHPKLRSLPYSRLEEFQSAAIFWGRRWPYVNPLQDAQADVLRIGAGLDSQDNVIRNSDRGGNYETVAAEIASCREVTDTHQVKLSDASGTAGTTESADHDDAAANGQIQQAALNGAQVTALAQMASLVAQGQLPVESALAIAQASFPLVPPQTMSAIFKPLKTFEPDEPEPAVAPRNGANGKSSPANMDPN